MEKKKELFKSTFIAAMISALIVVIGGFIMTKIPYYLEIIVVLIVSIIYSIKNKRITSQPETIIYAISYALAILIFQVVFITLKASFDVFFLVRLIFSFALLVPTMGKLTVIRLIGSYGLFFAVNRICYAYLNPQILTSDNINAWFKIHKKVIFIILTIIVITSTYILIPKPNSFVNTGNMHYPYATQAILLKNGNALILFGSNGKTEVYNPETGKFTISGSMNQLRNDYTATLLKNGKVLIIGGINSGRSVNASNIKIGMPISIADTELYDPETQQFKYSGKMVIPRQQHTAVLLPDGNVLVAGGVSYTVSNNKWSHKLLSSAEIYDVKTGKFRPTGNMNWPRRFFSAVLLKNGKVLITGGKSDDEDVLYAAEIYDPKTETFTMTNGLNIARMNHNSIALPNGNAVIIGGQTKNDGLKIPEIYNIQTKQFEKIKMEIGNNAIMLPDGKIFYASGGIEGSFFAPTKITNISEICDMEKFICTDVGKLKEYRYAHTAVLLNNDKVLVIGGYKNSRTPLTSAEMFTYNKKVE